MNSKLLFALGMVVALVLIAVSAGQLSTAPAAPLNAAEAPTRSLTVVGEGTASAKPDVARATIGVDTLARTIADATTQNNDKMNAVIAKLKSLGLADKDIQTSSYSINPERNVGKGPSSEITGYRVSNMVMVTIRDLDKVGAILDQATQAGANNIFGVSFGIGDTSKLKSEARAKAMADAQVRADDLARLGGVARGDIISISEVVGSVPIPFGIAAGMGGGGEAPIEPGSLNVAVRIQVVYTIK